MTASPLHVYSNAKVGIDPCFFDCLLSSGAMDPDKSEPVGEEVLLDVLEDDRVDPLVRSRAWLWLEGNDEAWEALAELP